MLSRSWRARMKLVLALALLFTSISVGVQGQECPTGNCGVPNQSGGGAGVPGGGTLVPAVLDPKVAGLESENCDACPLAVADAKVAGPDVVNGPAVRDPKIAGPEPAGC